MIVVTQGKGTFEDVMLNLHIYREKFQVLHDKDLIFDMLLSIVDTVAMAGKQIHDANIVATMHVHGIRFLLTHNDKHFVRYASYVMIIPLVQNPFVKP